MTSPTEVPSSGFILGENVYNKLKWLVSIVLPAVTTLVLAVGLIWGIQYTDKVGATLGAITFALGTILGISSNSYKKSDARFDGIIDVTMKEDGKKLHSLILNDGYDKIDEKKEILFRVSPPSEILPDVEIDLFDEPPVDIDLSPPDDPVRPPNAMQ